MEKRVSMISFSLGAHLDTYYPKHRRETRIYDTQLMTNMEPVLCSIWFTLERLPLVNDQIDSFSNT